MIFEKYKSDFSVKTNCVIFNPISDRKFWDNIGKSAVEYFENELKLYEDVTHEPLTASLYRDFCVNGNRSRYENIYFSRRSEIVCKTVLECIYNDDRYMRDILDLVWMILEETTWTVPAHNHSYVEEADSLPDFKRHTLDLFLAETACLVAFVYQTVGEKIEKLSTVVSRRIKDRLRHDVIDNYLERSDYWWMGYGEAVPNNWNPWINSNVLAVSMITETDDKRYTLWTTRSLYHNVPYIGGFEQKEGRNFAASDAFCLKKDDKLIFGMDLKNAYENRETINRWIRTMEFCRNEQKICVTEDFDFKDEKEFVLSFLTPQWAVYEKDKIFLTAENGEQLTLSFDDDFEISVGKIAYDDKLITADWGENLYRIGVAGKAKSKTVKYEIK